VIYVATGNRRLDVGKDANHSGQRSLDVHLLRTHQGGVHETKGPRTGSRESTCQVRRARENHADYVLDGNTVALEHFTQQLTNGIGHFLRVIVFEADGPTDSAHANVVHEFPFLRP
jgi:hypothetical protein